MTAGPEPTPAAFERIVPRRPANLGAPDTRGVVTAEPAAQISARAFWIAMLALLLIAALAFWLLPRFFSPPPATSVATPAPVEAPAAQAIATPAATAPAWDDPVLLEARAAAQGARERYAEQLAQLRAQGVERWGAAGLAAAEAQAQAAAAAFAAKDFAAARSGYEAAVAATAALLAGIPQRLATALAEAAQALDAGDKARAQAQYELALVLDPASEAAQRGLRRVANHDALRARLDTARRLEQAGDVAGARAVWKDALALDPDAQVAKAALARLDAQAADAEFGRVLGEALAALDRGDWDLAERRLARARALRANDAAVQQAGTRLAEARRGVRLAALEREAQARLAAEDWAGAVASYGAAQQIDASVAYAREGLARAEPRALLAQRMQDTLSKPERLASPAVMQEAVQLLEQARAVSDAGPRHREQLAALTRTIAAAATPVAVTLHSDSQTEVTVYKVGALGRFATHTLQLKPGRYTAVGARSGYRDVRVEFEVVAGAQNAGLNIRCTEPL